MRHAHSPDPAKGLFETMLVLDGHPVELDAHLERLEASLRVLYDAALPVLARRRALAASVGIALGRLRLTAAPHGDGLAVATAAAELDPSLFFPGPGRPVTLCDVEVTGGLGRHKWLDRHFLDRAEAACGDALPLLLDGDGTVLEVSRANVFAVRDGAVVTPAADGRIVPGIARRRAIELMQAAGRRVREGTLTLEDLLVADEVFITNAVRGVEHVRWIGDVPATGCPVRHSTAGTSGEGVGAWLASGLRCRWLGQAARAAATAAVP